MPSPENGQRDGSPPRSRYLMEMVESASIKKKSGFLFCFFFVAAHLFILPCALSPVSRHGWKPIWHKSWDLMEKFNGRFKGLPKKKKEKESITSEFSDGAQPRRFSPGRGHVQHFGVPPSVMTEAAYVGALWTLWVKLRGALGETGDGGGAAALTPFNLCWQFPAEKDISHSCLKNPNHISSLHKTIHSHTGAVRR